MYFRGHHNYFTMNERSNSKTDITFELRMVENLRRSIKGKMVLFTCTSTIHVYDTVYVTVHDTVHIDESMTWH